MTRRRRNRYSPEAKFTILKRHLVDNVAVSDICAEICHCLTTAIELWFEAKSEDL